MRNHVIVSPVVNEGKTYKILIPLTAISAIYPKENGNLMLEYMDGSTMSINETIEDIASYLDGPHPKIFNAWKDAEGGVDVA